MSEGGNITRIVLGESNWISEGDMNIIATESDVAFSASKKVFAHGVEEGLHVGEYDWKVEEDKNIDFTTGWWSYDYEGKKHLKRDDNGPIASLEETVYFHLNVSEKIPVGTVIKFKLWDEDTVRDDDTFNDKTVVKTGTVEEVDGKNRITIELFLDPNWSADVIADKPRLAKTAIDFYWEWEYNNTTWNSIVFLLRVSLSKTTLYIKPAYEGYGFPEIRSSDGELIVFSAGIVAVEEPSKELENAMDTILDDIKSNAIDHVKEKMVSFSDKLRYTIAVKQLKKGHLVNNLGKIEFSRRLYTKPVFDNSGELYEITQAANFGYRKEGQLITTKGISQLDYFREVGVRNTILKGVEKLSYVLDILEVLKFGMDGKTETITTMFAPLDFLNAMVYPSIREPIEKIWDGIVSDAVEKAKDNGIRGIYDLANAEWFNKERYGVYEYTRIDQEILNKLLKGIIKTLKELTDLQESQLIKSNYDKSKFIYTILYYTKTDEETAKNITYVDTIFIN